MEMLFTSQILKVCNLLPSSFSIIKLSPVQASLQSNTYVISGNGETKPLQDLFPGILNQMGPENVNALRQLMGAMAAQGGFGAPSGAPAAEDDEIPDLVENFEEAANK
jgi:nascent polypeptide-associated complex subunit beta